MLNCSIALSMNFSLNPFISNVPKKLVKIPLVLAVQYGFSHIKSTEKLCTFSLHTGHNSGICISDNLLLLATPIICGITSPFLATINVLPIPILYFFFQRILIREFSI